MGSRPASRRGWVLGQQEWKGLVGFSSRESRHGQVLVQQERKRSGLQDDRAMTPSEAGSAGQIMIYITRKLERRFEHANKVRPDLGGERDERASRSV